MMHIEIRRKSCTIVSQIEKNDEKAVKIDIFAQYKKVFSLYRKVHFQFTKQEETC